MQKPCAQINDIIMGLNKRKTFFHRGRPILPPPPKREWVLSPRWESSLRKKARKKDSLSSMRCSALTSQRKRRRQEWWGDIHNCAIWTKSHWTVDGRESGFMSLPHYVLVVCRGDQKKVGKTLPAGKSIKSARNKHWYGSLIKYSAVSSH